MICQKFYILLVTSWLCLFCVAGLRVRFAEAQGQAFNPSTDPASIKILEQMDSYLSPIEAFSFQIDVTDQFLTDNGEMLEIKKEAVLTVQRPNRLKAEVKIKEPQRERTFYYNGETITLYDKTENLYAQIKAPDTSEKALDYAMSDLGFTFPVVDFIFKNLKRNLTENVITSDYLGESVLKGRPAHQLVFHQDKIDWYLWIDSWKEPVPRKILIVYKNDPRRSKFIAEFTKFKPLTKISEETFNFKPPKEAEQIEFLPVEKQDNEETP